MQEVLAQEGRIDKGVGRTRVDQSLAGDRRLAGNENVDQQGKVARGGERKGDRRGGSASQPGPYWLGCPFFGREEGSKEVWGEGGKKGGGTGVQGPGKGPGWGKTAWENPAGGYPAGGYPKGR